MKHLSSKALFWAFLLSAGVVPDVNLSSDKLATSTRVDFRCCGCSHGVLPQCKQDLPPKTCCEDTQAEVLVVV